MTQAREEKAAFDRSPKDRPRSAGAKAPYEAPKAIFTPVKLQERLMNCGLTSYCAPNQYYQ
jgi:hypothetical protein